MNQTNLLQKFFAIKTIYVFLAIVVIYVLALSIEFKYIYNDDFYQKELIKPKHISSKNIDKFISDHKDIEWLNYPIILVIILVPTIAVSTILFIGSILKEYKIKFAILFTLALKSQIVFAINYLFAVIFSILGILKIDLANLSNIYWYQSFLVF